MTLTATSYLLQLLPRRLAAPLLATRRRAICSLLLGGFCLSVGALAIEHTAPRLLGALVAHTPIEVADAATVLLGVDRSVPFCEQRFFFTVSARRETNGITAQLSTGAGPSVAGELSPGDGLALRADGISAQVTYLGIVGTGPETRLEALLRCSARGS